MRRTERGGALLVLALMCRWGESQAVATTQRPPKAPTAADDSIAGQVVSGLDGHPLPGATVQIGDDRGQGLMGATVADAEGRFRFARVKPGKYTLSGTTAGYLPTAYEQHEQFWTGVVTGAGLGTESLVLRLTPAALLAGHVTDETGDPVRNAEMTLYRENRDQGRTEITPVSKKSTDDLGAYEFPALRPGRYYVRSTATPWYATYPQVGGGGQREGAATADPSLNVIFPMTFYPDVTRSEDAAAIAVKAGEQVSIDVHLKAIAGVTLRSHLTPSGTPSQVPRLQRLVFGEPEDVGGQEQVTESETVLAGIAPGQYVMQELDPKSGAAMRYSTVDLSGGSAEADPDSVQESASLHVVLQTAPGAKSAAVMVGLVPGASLAAGAQFLPANDKGEVEFAGVRPGAYRLLFAGAQQFHPTRLIANGRALPGGVILLAPGGAMEVVATVSTASVTVEGIVKRDGRPAGGSMVVLVPAATPDAVELYRRDQSDLDGSFVLRDVTPGNYIAMAIDDGWSLEWGRVDQLTRYLLHGLPVTISESAARSVHLPAAIVAQTR